jgi:tetratricopeptide (TPR) repeat protein
MSYAQLHVNYGEYVDNITFKQNGAAFAYIGNSELKLLEKLLIFINMKPIIFVIIILLSLTASAQKMTYNEWQAEAKENMRLFPEYGNLPKTDAIKKIDDEFIQRALAIDTTYRKASDKYVDLGFKYMLRGDVKTAMYRFNQAWLLDHTNENAYWGFGAVYFQFDDLEEAQKMYDKGLTINPRSTNILTDKATIYLAKLNSKFDTTTLNTAIDLFSKSYSIDPNNQNTTYKMSTMYFAIGDCKNARKYYDLCMKAGGRPVVEEYTKALNDACK